jgi:hypothetical protein
VAIMAPSSTMKETWLFARLPPKPPLSSATRKEHLIRIATVDIAIARSNGLADVAPCGGLERVPGIYSPDRKNRNLGDSRSERLLGFTLKEFRLTDHMSWQQIQINAKVEAT